MVSAVFHPRPELERRAPATAAAAAAPWPPPRVPRRARTDPVDWKGWPPAS